MSSSVTTSFVSYVTLAGSFLRHLASMSSPSLFPGETKHNGTSIGPATFGIRSICILRSKTNNLIKLNRQFALRNLIIENHCTFVIGILRRH